MNKPIFTKQPLIYLAAPYTHGDPYVIETRYVAMNGITTRILNEQNFIIPYSPISHTHRIGHKVDGNFDWYAWSLQHLSRCDGMIIVELDGWETSKGVAIENEFAIAENMPVVRSKSDEIIQVCEDIFYLITKGDILWQPS